MFAEAHKGPAAIWLRAVIIAAAWPAILSGQTDRRIQFVFTSDAHYGLFRPEFRGQANVPSRIVNRAMVAQINSLPQLTLPADGGMGAGQPVGAIDFVAEAGD